MKTLLLAGALVSSTVNADYVIYVNDPMTYGFVETDDGGVPNYYMPSDCFKKTVMEAVLDIRPIGYCVARLPDVLTGVSLLDHITNPSDYLLDVHLKLIHKENI